MNPFLDKTLEPFYRESKLTFLDVGARDGIPSHWRGSRKYLRVIGFEPDKLAYEDLKSHTTIDSNDKYLPIALSDVHGDKTFYETRSPGVSSILKPNKNFLHQFPNPERFDVLSTTNMEVKPLDLVIQEENIQDADFIKIDTQGSELSVLHGAVESLNKLVFGVELEVEFTQLYEDQPLFSDIDQFLRDQGFILFDLRTVHWKRALGKDVGGRKGQLIFGDALYFKSSDQFISQCYNRKDKLLKALTICVLYGYFDYALCLCAESQQANILSVQERDLIYKCLTKPRHLSTKWPWIPGRDRLANLIWVIHDIFRSYYWAHSGSSATGHRMGNTGDSLLWG